MRVGCAVILMLVSVGAGCGGPAPAQQFVDQAERLHRQALARAQTTDSDLGEYVQAVGQRIEEAARKAAPQKAQNDLFSQVQFHLVGSPTVNAFTTGGTHVYVYTALFGFCETEEELAAAMAHAYAHVLNLDVENLGIRPDKNRPLPQVVYEFVTHRFTLPQEREADRLAFLIYARGGWDPEKFANLFERLRDRFPDNFAPDRQPLFTRAQTTRGMAGGASRSWRKLTVADPRTFTALRNQARSPAAQASGSADADLFLRAFPNCLLSSDQPEQREAQNRLRPPAAAQPKLEPS